MVTKAGNGIQSGALIDAQAAAQLLGVPSTWILAEARSNRIPHVRLGRYVRFRREALLAWVLERERGPLASRSRPTSAVAPSARSAA